MVTKRFFLALLASLALHALILAPFAGWLSSARAPAPAPLAVRLPPLARAEALATEAEEPAMRPRAVPPAPTLAPREPPRPLRGRALQSALAALSREEFYPREAIRQGLEGRVVLLLTLDEAGRVERIEVASSSGHALLDDAARRAAARIDRLPAGRRQALLPVEFRLE
ncbi:MAG: TonB family protein [Rhodocyclaceae bacterium]|jgi:protein TonB|nr:TonB family protein [Rhodocyclaceae bacterium]